MHGAVLLRDEMHFRTWAHQGHFTFDNVDELRQFVQAVRRKNRPMRVTRGSLESRGEIAYLGAPERMDRNL